MANTQKRILPTEENPRYGSKFIVVGIQLQDIDGYYTEMMDFKIMNKEDKEIPRLFSAGKSWGEWKRIKEKLSDEICTSLNKMRMNSWHEERKRALAPFLAGPAPVNFKDVVALKVRYFGDRKTVVL